MQYTARYFYQENESRCRKDTKFPIVWRTSLRYIAENRCIVSIIPLNHGRCKVLYFG